MKKKKKGLKRRIRELERELAEEKSERMYFERRLRVLGADERIRYDREKTDGITHVAEAVNIKPIPYGCYVKLEEEGDIDLEARKKFLVTNLVKSLMDRNLVRIIYRKPTTFDPPWRKAEATLGARIDVVPWELLVKKEDVENVRSENQING